MREVRTGANRAMVVNRWVSPGGRGGDGGD
jgi:hypothetical protein